jgi:sulfonate transport system permease protein
LDSDSDSVSGARARAALGARLSALRQPGRSVRALIVPCLLLAALETSARLGWVPAHLLPPPSEIAHTLIDLAGQGLLSHIVASSVRVLVGFLAGAALAIVIGAVVGLNPQARELLDPTFQALRAIPSLAWVPLLLIWLGIDEAPKLTLIALGAFFPVYMGVVSGFCDVDRKLLEVAAMAGLGPVATVRRVLLPASLPALLTGLRNGLSLAWMFMVAAELIAASRGLGYLLTDGRETGRTDIVLAAIVVLALLGKLSDGGMRWLEERCLSWRDTLGSNASGPAARTPRAWEA